MSNSPSANSTSDLTARLLHHLVEFSRVFKKTADPAVQALNKKNNELVNELLLNPLTALSVGQNASVAAAAQNAPVAAAAQNAPVTAVAVPVDWKNAIMQKLADAQVNLADEKVKKEANEQVEATSKKIDDLISSLVRHATSFTRTEDKVTFEFDPKSIESIPSQAIYLRGLTFTITAYTSTVDVFGTCSGIPAGKTCKVLVEVTVKNHAGRRDIVRCFSKVLTHAVSTTSLANAFEIYDLIQQGVYQDESLGFLKDGKLVVEVTVRVDELTDYTPPAAGAYDPITGAYNDFVDIYDDGL